MNPAPLMGLVELVRGMQTSDATFEASRRLIAHLGKIVGVSRDRPGFLINRILLPMINEAFCALMEVRCFLHGFRRADRGALREEVLRCSRRQGPRAVSTEAPAQGASAAGRGLCCGH